MAPPVLLVIVSAVNDVIFTQALATHGFTAHKHHGKAAPGRSDTCPAISVGRNRSSITDEWPIMDGFCMDKRKHICYYTR